MSVLDRVAELEAEVAFLRAELGYTRDGDLYVRLRDAWRLTRSEAAMLLRLYSARGRAVPNSVLLEALSENDVDPAIVKVRISTVRQKIGQRLIETIWGLGYRLTPEGVAAVLGVIEPPSDAVAA